MNVLCLGGTGTVGSEVVARLVERGASVRCMTRSDELAGTTADGISYVRGDLEDPSGLGPVFEGVDRLHLLTPVHPNEAMLGAAAVDAAKNAGVGRIVLHSVHRVEEAPQIPHFASKIRMLEAIEASGLGWVTIEPNNYYQNDYWLKDPILRMGIYPSPMGSVGLSRVDVRDIADATVNALLDDGHEGMRYPLAGPEVLTGADTAAAWSRGLGREIHYAGDDLDAWEEAARAMMPEWMVEDVRIMFAHFLERGLKATDEDLAFQDRVLGHAPRRFDDFVAETVAMWAEG
jgi:uncharacterized protein YbjT (DUF2867 family)